MAYTLFPKTTKEILDNCKAKPDNAVEIATLFKYLRKKFPAIKTPINIDVKILGKINVSRELQGSIELKDIKKDVKMELIKIKFGAGSAGNRGVKNRGNLFENTFANAVRQCWDDDDCKNNDQQIRKAVDDLEKLFNFSKLKGLIVKEEGDLNVRRPLKFSPGPFISSPTGGLDIGRTVTDLTLHEAKTENQANNSNVLGFLSLKLGNTTTFFNIGVKTILTKDEIMKGEVKNKDGLKLLNMFGIDNKTFCKIFNGKLKRGIKTNTFSKANKSYLREFLKSGIGFGYTVVHKLSNEIKVFKMTKQKMEQTATPLSCDIFYGGKTGTGKRIDMEIRTKSYQLKINIRDTQGVDGYPTRIMGDFSYL